MPAEFPLAHTQTSAKQVAGATPDRHEGRDGAEHECRAVADRMAGDGSVLSAGVLRMRPHACDRTYQHSAHPLCAGPDVARTRADGARLPAGPSGDYAWAMRTWTPDGETARFCDIRLDRGADNAGFLSPYRFFPDAGAPRDTLREVPTTVRACGDFETCPAPSFKVDAEAVYRQVWRRRWWRGLDRAHTESRAGGTLRYSVPGHPCYLRLRAARACLGVHRCVTT